MNDGMGAYVAKEVVKLMIQKGIAIKDAKVLMLGITFKENCPDVRNTKIVDVIAALQDYGLQIDIFDPWASAEEVKHEYHLNLIHEPLKGTYDGIVLAVAHQDFKTLDLNQLKAANAVVYDVKGVLNEDVIDARL